MKYIKIYFLMMAILWGVEVSAASMFNDLQNQDKENERLCKQFQEKLRKAILSDDLSAASKVDGYKKRVKLYCLEDTSSGTMFSGLQNEDVQNVYHNFDITEAAAKELFENK